MDFKEDDVFAKFISGSIKGLEPDVAKLFEDNANEERQLQFWSVSRYNAELRQWIEENPDKVGRDFFQFSEALKHEYWNKNIEDLRALKIERETELTGEEPGKLDATTAREILNEAGGDKAKARKIAKERGFKF